MLPQAIEDLSEKFQVFPGIGKRSSQKLALDLLELDIQKYQELLGSLQQVRQEISFCKTCGFSLPKNNQIQSVKFAKMRPVTLINFVFLKNQLMF